MSASARERFAQRLRADPFTWREPRVHSVGVLLSDLLADPELGLSPLAQAGDPVLRGVYITDLLDPRRYLADGELVLTGMMWRTGPDDSERFAAAIADAGVAALAAGTARLGSTPPDLVEACRRRGVPLVEVPLALSFGTLSERVMAANRAPGRDWVAAVAAGADLEQVFDRAAAELGADCWALSATGRIVAGSAPLPQRDELVRDYLTGRTTQQFAVRTVGEGSGPRIAHWFVVVRSAASAAAELATVAALVRTRVDQARQIAGQSVESALRRLLDGTSSAAEVVARLETVGLPAGEPARVVLLSTGQDPVVEPDSADAIAVLREFAAATGLASVTAPLRDGAAAVFAADERRLAELPDRFRELLAHAEPALRAQAGISDVRDPGNLRAAVEEAGYALQLAERAPRNSVVPADELATHRALLAAVPAELRTSYRERVLGPLFAYDAAHAADLVRTLRMFLECGGSWSRCAGSLHIHVNTLRYRIGRVERITGRDLGNFSTRVDFHLALGLAAEDAAASRG